MMSCSQTRGLSLQFVSKYPRIFCYRRKSQRVDQKMNYHVNNRTYDSINIWGSIFGAMETPLMRINGRLTSETYISYILEAHVVPFQDSIVSRWCKCTHHITVHVQQWPLQDHNVNWMPWSTFSPDLTLSETPWSFSSARWGRNHRPRIWRNSLLPMRLDG